jgi:DNA-binding transcriptional LysR family regulator
VQDRLSGFTLFAAVVEAGSFTAAAAGLGMTKSAVSKAVSRLEARLGARLLNRTTRRLRLTEAGRSFHERCVRILAEAEEAEQAVSDLQLAPRGTLRINAPVIFGMQYLAALLPDFMVRYPDLAVEVSLNDRYVDLVEEGYDVAVRIGRLADSSLVARRLCESRHVVCAAPGYWERRGRPGRPADLAAHDCLLYSYLSTGDQWRFEGPDGPVSVRVSGPLSSNNGDVLRVAALAGRGVVLLPLFSCGRDLAAGRLEAALAEFVCPAGGLHAVYPPDRRPPAKVRAFVDFLVARLGRAPFGEGVVGP